MTNSDYRDITDALYMIAFVLGVIAGGALIFGHWLPIVTAVSLGLTALAFGLNWWRWGV